MAKLILFNKPYHTLTKFTDNEKRQTLALYINEKGVYPAGRLDYDSEGLLVLTDLGWLQALISEPKHKLTKTYLVQVEGAITEDALELLRRGVLLKDGVTKPAQATPIEEPSLWERTPPVRYRKDIPTSWIRLTIKEGKNRQVRRMTAAVGFPTLRLVRQKIGPWRLGKLPVGQWVELPCPKTPQEALKLFRK